MNEILSIALRSMHQDIAGLDRIATNLTNAMTPAYKREVVARTVIAQTASAPTFAAVMDASTRNGTFSTSGLGHDSPAAQIAYVDQRPGSLKITSQSLDLAILGEGYFEVSTSNGPAYTRQGDFRLDNRGRLTTAQGIPVVGTRGEIFISHANPRIDESGNVFEISRSAHSSSPQPLMPGVGIPPTGEVSSSQLIGQIKVVKFEREASLLRIGGGLLTSTEPPIMLAEADVQIRQGSLENSNVSLAQEMVQMIQTMRHFESMQRAIIGYDEMLGGAIRKLGDLS